MAPASVPPAPSSSHTPSICPHRCCGSCGGSRAQRPDGHAVCPLLPGLVDSTQIILITMTISSPGTDITQWSKASLLGKKLKREIRLLKKKSPVSKSLAVSAAISCQGAWAWPAGAQQQISPSKLSRSVFSFFLEGFLLLLLAP